MDEIVHYGKKLFTSYYSGEISFAELEKEVASKASTLSSNDFAVLGCYCERDVDATFMLHKIHIIKMAKEMLPENDVNPKMAFIMLCSEIQKMGVPLDSHFTCFRFTPMVVEVWKEVWGDRWHLILEAGEATVIRLPFFKPIFDAFIK